MIKKFLEKKHNEINDENENNEKNDINDEDTNTYIKSSIKEIVFEISAMPITIQEKKTLLKARLQNDKFLNKYVDKHAINKLMKYFINDHVKAGILYIYHYSQAYNMK